MDDDLLLPFLGELQTAAEYTAQEISFIVNSEGQTIYYILRRIAGPNGVAKEMMRVVGPNATGTAYVASNMALLSMEVPTALAFIGPALGIAVGAGILSQTELFQNVGSKIGESLYCFINGDGQVYFPEETINAFAEVFREQGAFTANITNNYQLFQQAGYPEHFSTVSKFTFLGMPATQYDNYMVYWEVTSTDPLIVSDLPEGGSTNIYFKTANATTPPTISYIAYKVIDNEIDYDSIYASGSDTFNQQFSLNIGEDTYTWYGGASTWLQIPGFHNSISLPPLQYADYEIDTSVIGGMPKDTGFCFLIAHGDITINTQPEAVVPPVVPFDFPTLYPQWIPDTIYPEVPNEETLYPIAIPGTIPNIPTPQPEIQTPDPLVDPATDPRTDQISQLIDDLVLPTPTPIPSPTPQPSPDPDPAPSVNPDPPLDPTQPVEPNPPSANIDPDPDSPTIYDPALVSAAGKLFTVYNPSSSAIDSLGAFLWSTNVIDIIKTIWQNPMDAVISYFVLYATPEANANGNIYLGSLNSEVSSPIVTNQFIDINCGEIQIKEKWQNIADYPPYTSIKLFLPFVGFVDINPDDVMGNDDGGGWIKVTYRVDVYTGTCLAQVWVKRAADMSNYQILYTYNGNCAQQMPLTGATYQGLMQTLVGASVGFATAGLTGALASGATQFAGHQQVQMQRSGNMSANAGVLGQRKPYLIISRNNVYYATNFAEYYGYPAHATVVLGNMSGYVRVRDIHLEVPATSEEIDEIETLLKEGVWF